jgi:hypothetical protein
VQEINHACQPANTARAATLEQQELLDLWGVDLQRR